MSRSFAASKWFTAFAITAMACALGWGAAETHSVAAGTDDSHREPILRIETGMHTAGIRGIGIDAANKYLVTASYDKTIRVWNLPSLHLVRVIRPPIGEGDDGKLTTVALSPDGRTIVAGMHGPPGGETVVLFDLQTGKLEKRLDEVSSTPLDVEFSRDGRYLAVTQFFGNLLVYDASNYKLIAEDNDCAAESYGAAFDAQGRLITTCDDGFIREYGVTQTASLNHLVRVKAMSGKRPRPVVVSPDGSEIAVGFEDTPRIDVLSLKDLSLLFLPDMSGTDELATSGLSWSADGNTLYAGGERLNPGDEPIRAWADGGRGAYRETAASDNTITQILPLRSGGLVFSSFTPSLGIIDGKGNRSMYTGRAIPDYRHNLDGFLLSEDGSTVQFGYEFGGKSPARYSLAERRLDTAPVGTERLNRAVVERFPISDWVNSTLPKLNGKPLPIVAHEVSRSLAITPDRSGFLLGTEWNLYFFGADGSPRWKVEAPGTAWDVNISGDGRLGVAAYGDGSIRWYRMSDGEELLAFFPDNDRKRWVIWTPSGYYDASSGGEGLIGWHVNNGRDNAADFFPVGQFRSTYYRPDIVAKILETGDEEKAILASNGESGRKTRGASVTQMLPPVVEIVSPADGADVTSSNVSVRYAVRSPSGETLKDVKILVDGRPASGERGVALASTPANGDALEADVNVPPRDTTISVIATNRFASSTPATVHLIWRGTNAEGSQNNARLFVLAIGVSHYADPALQLQYAAKDAQDFATALQRQKGGLYRDVLVKLLTDDGANRDDVLDGLDWIRTKATSDDVAMVLLSGHGVNDERGKYFFLPHDANMEKLLRTGVSMDDIETAISSLKAKTLFFVDTCHSGNVSGGRKGDRPDINGLINELASPENGAVVFAASTGTQSSIEDAKWSNGAFTKALVEGLNGKADYGSSGRITVTGLELYIENRVPELTQDQQTPMTQKPGMVSNYTIALKQ
ncbi:MAG: caspase family protein [Candidatus Acidiferrales bacterium]|jgi:DNA-binding beta-propeller fold protein YncE